MMTIIREVGGVYRQVFSYFSISCQTSRSRFTLLHAGLFTSQPQEEFSDHSSVLLPYIYHLLISKHFIGFCKSRASGISYSFSGSVDQSNVT